MPAEARDFIPTYVSEIIKETDGDLDDCMVCAAISLADAWTLGEFLTRSDGDKRNVINLREKRAKALGPSKAVGGLTLADAERYLQAIDPDIPNLPRYPGHGGSQRYTFEEFWDLISDGHAAILLGNPSRVKDPRSPLRTKQGNDDYPHAIFVYRGRPTVARVYDALTRHGPDWRGEDVEREDLRQFSTAFGTPGAIGCSVVRIGAATRAARERNAKEVAVRMLKVSNKNLVAQRDEVSRELDIAVSDLQAAEARIAILESATQPDLTLVRREARQSFKDEALAAVGSILA